MIRSISLVMVVALTTASLFAQPEVDQRQALTPGRGNPAARPADVQTVQQFLEIERIARLGPQERAQHLNELLKYAEPLLDRIMIEAVLSTSPPIKLLDPQRVPPAPSGDELTRLWGQELDQAARTMSPQQVASAIQTNHGINILRVAVRRRALYVLDLHRPQLLVLLEKNIAGNDPAVAKVAFSTIHELHISELADRCMDVYLAGGPHVADAQQGLSWISRNPALAKRLIENVEKNPANLTYHALLLSEMLWDQPPDVRLTKYLDSSDAAMREAAAVALLHTTGDTMAARVPRLLDDPDAGVRCAGAHIALLAPPEYFAMMRPSLIRLLSFPDMQVQIAAAGRLASQQDPVAGPWLLNLVKDANLDRAYRSRVLMAVRALLGEPVQSYLANWGSDAPLISRLEQWIKAHPVQEQ